jgi:hypothetical protein
MLSSIQQGIQSGHAAMELVNKYYDNQNPTYVVDEHNWEVVLDWIQNDKTIVCLNGGNSESMFEWETFLNTYENPFPWVAFHEDESSMEGILTSIALILPERIYGVDLEELYAMASFIPGKFTSWEWELVNRVKSTGLAR